MPYGWIQRAQFFEVKLRHDDRGVTELIFFLRQRMQFTEHAHDLSTHFYFGRFAWVQVVA